MRQSSEDSKAAILVAAREQFARKGYELTTIRAVAADAGIDPSMVMRYFGTKQNLFSVAASFDLHLPDLLAVPRDQVGTTLVMHFLDIWEADESMNILLRTAVTSETVAARVRAMFVDQVESMVMRIHNDPERARTSAGLAASQLIGVAMGRYILRLPPLVDMALEAIGEQLAPIIQRLLIESEDLS